MSVFKKTGPTMKVRMVLETEDIPVLVGEKLLAELKRSGAPVEADVGRYSDPWRCTVKFEHVSSYEYPGDEVR